MGRKLLEIIETAPDLALAAAVDPKAVATSTELSPNTSPNVSPNHSANVSAKVPPNVSGSGASGIQFAPDLSGLSPGECDAVVEFSVGSAPAAIAPQVVRLGDPWICGTTGLTAESRRALEDAARRIPVLWSPNMSLGAAVLAHLCAEAARLLPQGWELEVVEAHHAAKLDAPSGTALALAEGWIGIRGGQAIHGRSGRTGPRPPAEVGIHAVRLPEGIGEHRLLLGGRAESLELVHRALDRSAFAIGALTAARWIRGKGPGFYSVDEWVADRLSTEDSTAS